eukprot:6202165-Pleurochrysis_carterae.AAC.1
MHEGGYAKYIRCLQRIQCCVVRRADVCFVGVHCDAHSTLSAREFEWRLAQTRAASAFEKRSMDASQEGRCAPTQAAGVCARRARKEWQSRVDHGVV